MNFTLKTPGAIWAEALNKFKQEVFSFLQTKITVEFKVYYINDEDDEGLELNDSWDFIIENCDTLCIAEIIENDIRKVVHINTNHLHTFNNCEDNYVNFDFIIYDESEKSGENFYEKITDIRFSYQILHDIKIYEEIANWINGVEFNTLIFTENKYKNVQTLS